MNKKIKIEQYNDGFSIFVYQDNKPLNSYDFYQEDPEHVGNLAQVFSDLGVECTFESVY